MKERKEKKNKVLVGMSGGVDSSVAVKILKENGMDVIGATIRMFNPEEYGLKNDEKDMNDAKEVAAKMNCEHIVVESISDFRNCVIDKFAKSYTHGLTPNPCVDCNKNIKFKKLLEISKKNNVDYIATGHYAKVEYDEKSDRFLLKKGDDLSKDQSYVLYTLNQEVLSKVIFPLGNLNKEKIREIARNSGMEISEKKDSQDICFIKDGNYKDFLQDNLGVKSKKGDYVDKNGEKIGEHEGIISYTIGQRKGLGKTFGKPMFVQAMNPETNTVTLTEEKDLYSTKMIVKDVNFISIESLKEPMDVRIKARYNMKEVEGIIRNYKPNMVEVEFKEPQRAITPGQSAVFYLEDVVVGGGIIV